MKDLTKIYIDLRNCDIWEKKQIEICTRHELVENKNYPFLIFYRGKWDQGANSHVKDKTELTYPDFIKLFEGGDGENNVNYYDSANRFIQSILDSDWLLDSEQQTKLTDLYINHRISEGF